MPASCAKAFSPTIALLGCGPKVMMRGEQLAAREEMLGHDAGFERQLIAAGVQRHDDFFERGVAGALADAVDGAFDLACAALDRRQRIRHRQAQIVVAVHADDRRIAQGLHDPRDQSAIFFGNGKPYGVRKVDGPRAGGDHRARYLLQVIRIGAGGVLGRKLHVVAVFAGEPYGRHGFVQNLLPRFLQLVLQVDVAGGDEGVNARAPGILERIGRAPGCRRGWSAPAPPRSPTEIRAPPRPPLPNRPARRSETRLREYPRPVPPAWPPCGVFPPRSCCSPAIAPRHATWCRRYILDRPSVVPPEAL